MIASKNDLLSLCVSELPEEEFTGKNGVTVKIRALKGSEAMRAVSIENLDERLLYALPKMIMEPCLTFNETRKIVDFQADFATDVFTRGMEMSNALGDAEEQEKDSAKKN